MSIVIQSDGNKNNISFINGQYIIKISFNDGVLYLRLLKDMIRIAIQPHINECVFNDVKQYLYANNIEDINKGKILGISIIDNGFDKLNNDYSDTIYKKTMIIHTTKGDGTIHYCNIDNSNNFYWYQY